MHTNPDHILQLAIGALRSGGTFHESLVAAMSTLQNRLQADRPVTQAWLGFAATHLALGKRPDVAAEDAAAHEAAFTGWMDELRKLELHVGAMLGVPESGER